MTPDEAGLILDYYFEQQLKLEKELPKISGKSGLSDDDYSRLDSKRAKLRAKGLQVL